MEVQEKQFIKGFNDGYLVAEHEPRPNFSPQTGSCNIWYRTA